jgi:hypothetical protein
VTVSKKTPALSGSLALVLQMTKPMVARALRRPPSREPFWTARYYDFNVRSERKRVEKLRYLHRNPVKRGLVKEPEEWAWSSYRHYLTGAESGVEVESPWAAKRREEMGIFPTVSRRVSQKTQPPQKARQAGAPAHRARHTLLVRFNDTLYNLRAWLA